MFVFFCQFENRRSCGQNYGVEDNVYGCVNLFVNESLFADIIK